MSKNHWIVTRPKRKLVVVPEMLKVFATVAVGKQWSGNRDLQREFERELVRFEWKAQNLSRDGSGSRTYVALLSMLGLWYEDDGVVKLTQAGKEIISGEPTVPLLTKQLINLQYPSPYSVAAHIDASFKVQPHRFVINLLSDVRVGRLSQSELAYCVLPYAKSNNHIPACVDRILEYRGNPNPIRQEALTLSGATANNLENIANTIINQLEYTGFFKYRVEVNASLEFEVDGEAKARAFIDNHGRGIVANNDTDAIFQTRFGSGINITKDYSATNPVQPTINPTDRLVLMKFYEIAQKRPIFGIGDDLESEISSLTGVAPSRVKLVLSKIANQPLLDNFEERYINLSKGGTETATEFEKVTTNLFGSGGFGLDSEWVGARGAYPDIFVYIDKEDKIHGIVDTKAYKVYPLSIDQRNKMAHTYIPNFDVIQHDGFDYKLGFFAYIAGGFGPNMQSNFERLRSDAGGMNGCYISAYDFMQLLRRHRAHPFVPKELLKIFSQNKQIVYDEL